MHYHSKAAYIEFFCRKMTQLLKKCDGLFLNRGNQKIEDKMLPGAADFVSSNSGRFSFKDRKVSESYP